MKKKVHFLGIGGIGMSSLAQYLHCRGYVVSGCEREKSRITDMLAEMQIPISFSHSIKHCRDINMLIYTLAASNNKEIKYCAQQGIKTVSREQLLGNIVNAYENSIAVSGAHGKTTTCGMLVSALMCCQLTPTAFVGGLLNGHGNYVEGDSAYCVAEACEYKDSFLTLFAKVGVILNVDMEHLDYYKQLSNIEQSFNNFAKNTKDCVIINGDNVSSTVTKGLKSKVVTFGFDAHNQYSATNVKRTNANYSFDLVKSGAKLGRVNLTVLGRHNIYNALAALAVCDYFCLPIQKAIMGVSCFSGVERRFMTVKNSFTNIIEDYAHHPNEIIQLIATAKQCGYKKLYTVFQPHTYSRTHKLFTDFVTCFLGVDCLLLVDIYSAREQPIKGVTSQALVNSINKAEILPAIYCCSFIAAEKYIRKNATKDDLVLIVGAGDIYKLSKKLST